MARRALVILAALALGGCAAQRRVVQGPPPALRVDVEALLRRGCFHCFEDALAAARASGDSQRAFEAAVLLVLRARELGLPADERIATMRELTPAAPGWSDLADVVSAVPPDPLAGEQYARPFMPDFQRARRVRDLVDGWRAHPEATPATGWFRDYVALAVTCAIEPSRGETAGVTATTILDRWPDVPAIRFLVGSCTKDPAMLAALRATDERFVDVEYPLGRWASEGRVPDYDQALKHLQTAHEAFPESTAAAVALGTLRLDREEWTEALAAFDDVLTTAPLHRDALLGRVVALSRQARYDESIAAASHMIDLGEWLLGPAYYWRAFDELQMKRLDAAAGDRDSAKRLMSNAAVYLLSGLIEWGQRHLPPAEAEFQQAVSLDFGQCDAALYMGAVRHELRRDPEAVAAFKQAIQCYDLSIAVRRKAVDEIRAGGGSEAGKAGLIARHERAIAEATSQRDEAARDVAEIEGL